MERQPITREGYDKLVAEVKHLGVGQMPEIAKAIARPAPKAI